jgi:hypothetical protein
VSQCPAVGWVVQTFLKAYWVYEATYVEGLYANAQFVNNMADEAKASRRSSIRVSSKEKMDMLHSELFVGAFGKGVAFCYDNLGKNFKLNVITDNVDKSILNLFNERAQQLLSIGEERVHEVKGFDTDTSSIVKGSITFDYTQMTDILGDFSQVQYDISVSDSSLTVAADVLVNSVWYHLKTLQKTSPGCPLNTIEAISGHPLSSLVVGVTDSNSLSVQIADSIYRHPNQS